jgi:hypothetical protein
LGRGEGKKRLKIEYVDISENNKIGSRRSIAKISIAGFFFLFFFGN